MKTIFRLTLVALLLPLAACSGRNECRPLKIGTYNIQYPRGGGEEYPWEKRLPGTVEIINDMDLDVFGAQEPYLDQIEDIMAAVGQTYGCVGMTNVKGQEDPHGVHYNPIFYRKSRLELLEQGMFWLSDTPWRPSKFEDSYSLRICNWALFRDKITGNEFYHFNCHFDHKGVVARISSARLMLEKIPEIAGGKPAFLTGDFNSGQDSEAYRILAGSDLLVDSYDAAPKKDNGEWHTYNGYKYSDTPRENAVRIDHVFVTAGTDVLSWSIENGAYGGNYPSDHFPVTAGWCPWAGGQGVLTDK